MRVLTLNQLHGSLKPHIQGREFLLSRESLLFHGTFLSYFFKAWLEIVYSSSNSISANLLELSDDLLIFIFNSHPAEKEKLINKKAAHHLACQSNKCSCWHLLCQPNWDDGAVNFSKEDSFCNTEDQMLPCSVFMVFNHNRANFCKLLCARCSFSDVR